MKTLAKFKNLAPLGGLLLVTLFFAIATGGAVLDPSNMQSLGNQMIVTALVALGAVFVFGAGCFDMSIGGCVCLCAVLGAMVAIPTGSLALAFIVCMGTALILGLLKGLMAAYIEVPLFIVTIVLGMVINAAILVFMGKETTLYLRNAIPEIPALTFDQMTLANIATLGGFFIVCLAVFNYTGTGQRIKAVGGGPTAAMLSGVKLDRTRVLAFLFGAVGIGLAAFIILIRTRTVGNTTGGTLGTDTLVALVLGGMPISGGPRTKISAGLYGAATIAVLNNGLVTMGVSIGAIQIVRGLVFLAIVFVASWTYRTKLLPR